MNVKVPVAPGVNERVSDVTVKPAGSVPEMTPQTRGIAPPVTFNVWVYGTLNVASGSDVVVIVGGADWPTGVGPVTGEGGGALDTSPQTLKDRAASIEKNVLHTTF